MQAVDVSAVFRIMRQGDYLGTSTKGSNDEFHAALRKDILQDWI
jgi:hypothetical protein